jgi:hypothetical protein
MTTDFFAQQDRARKRTTLLLFYFALAVLGTIASLYCDPAAAPTGRQQ